MEILRKDPTRYHGKTIMVVGAGHVQEPAVKTAKELGLKVVAVDRDPKAPGLQWADHPLHISTDDYNACIEAARYYQVDGVMTSGSEQGTRTVAVVAAALGLPGIPVETAQKATNKIAIRQLAAEYNIPSPEFAICRSREDAFQALETLGLPLIVKPPDSHSSQGVSLVRERSELEKALIWATSFSKSGVWVLEEFIPPCAKGGTPQVFVVDGKVQIITTISGKSVPPPLRAQVYLTVPAADDISDKTQKQIREMVDRCVKALGITNGPLLTQFRIGPDGPRLIELSPRIAGMCISSQLIPLAVGVNIIQAVIDQCLGYEPDLTPRYSRGACQHYIILPPGFVRYIPDLKQFSHPNLVEIKLFVKPGDSVMEYYSAAVAPGYCITTGDTLEQAIDTASRICKEIISKIVVE